MGLNEHPTPGPDDELAAYALDAVDPDEAAVVETRLATDAVAARDAAVLTDAAGALAVTAAEMDPGLLVAPPADLRDRIVGTAHAARAPQPVAPAAAADIHRVESERVADLLRGLRPADWRRAVDPPEFAGWTVHDLAVHLAANETLLAQKLGAADPTIPETDDSNEARTTATRARHADLPPAEALAEYERAAAAVDDALALLGPDDLESEIHWWGAPMRIVTVLLVRSFETWIHADDIRRAVDLPALAPPSPSLRTMSTAAASWLPLMIAAGPDPSAADDAQAVRLVLTGPGGATHDIHLGDDAPPVGFRPEATLTLDIVDFCRAVGARGPAASPSGPLADPVVVEGDDRLAGAVLASLGVLAQL